MFKRKVVGIGCLLSLFLFAPFAFMQRPSAGAPIPPVSAFVISPAFELLGVKDSFTITVNLTNAQDLYDWQVVLKYNGTILNLTGLWVPDDNVFAGHSVIAPTPIAAYKPDVIDGLNSSIIGVTLEGPVPGIPNVDSGVLCKANFTVINAGQSLIEIADKSNPLQSGYPATSGNLWNSFWQNTTNILALPPFDEQDALGSNCTVFTESPLVGDVNGDFKVDMRDIAMVAAAFGTVPGDPRWNSTCDINGDGKVDLRDISLVAKNLGQHYP